MDVNKIKKVISVLETAKKDISKIIGDSNFSFALRITTVLNTLINNLKHTIGGNVESVVTADEKKKPLTSVFGQKIVSTEAKQGVAIDSAIHERPQFNSEVEKLREEVNALTPTLLNREAKEILLSVSQLHLKAVGKQLGLPYDDSAKINTEYIENIKEKLLTQSEENVLKEERKLGIDEYIEVSGEAHAKLVDIHRQESNQEELVKGDIVQVCTDENCTKKECDCEKVDAEFVEEVETPVKEEVKENQPVDPRQEEREKLIDEYILKFGKKPHPAIFIDTLKAKLAE